MTVNPKKTMTNHDSVITLPFQNHIVTENLFKFIQKIFIVTVHHALNKRIDFPITHGQLLVKRQNHRNRYIRTNTTKQILLKPPML